jgi:hypothetical protein
MGSRLRIGLSLITFVASGALAACASSVSSGTSGNDAPTGQTGQSGTGVGGSDGGGAGSGGGSHGRDGGATGADGGASSPDASGPPTPCSYSATAAWTQPGRQPRLYLTVPVLQRLQARAAAGDSGWTALKTRCDGLATGSANIPSGDAYPNFPAVGQGYEGDGYIPEVMNLGLCYRVVAATDPTTAAGYAAAGAAILDAMATPVGSGGQDPSTDDGYGIRNFGVGMATGYDWLYPGLSASTKSNVQRALEAWIDWYDASGFSNHDPIGNYFAGYLLAKTTAAIALDGDDAKAGTYWNDVETNLYAQLVKPSFGASMAGGGWPEGWEYGPKSVEEMVQFLWAAETGKGMTWWQDLPQARDQAEYMSYFAWPSLLHMDDQGTVHAQTALAPSAVTAQTMAMALEYHCDAYAPTARSFAADLLAAEGEDGAAWQAFLFWDGTLSQTPYTSGPTSYFAPGPNHVAMRSSWQKDATWGAFVSGQYIDAPESGEQYFNQGALNVVVGDQPLLVDATGWLPQAAGSNGENFVYDDTWGSQTRLLDNTFYVSGVIQDQFDPTQASTHVEHYEDTGTMVHTRGVQIEQMYAHSGVSQFTREVVYMRPGTFVVYDRTTIPSAGTDQWLAWHLPAQPVAGTASDPTQVRYDVNTSGFAAGSVRTLLPKNATANSVSILSGVVWRLEMHAPSSAAAEDWLTVVTAGSTVPDQTRLSAGDGNVQAGNVVGVHVLDAGRNAVVLFSADHAAKATSTSVHYTVAQTADADHVVLDVAPNASGYGVTVTPNGNSFDVDVEPNGALQPSPEGTLGFVVTATGQVK